MTLALGEMLGFNSELKASEKKRQMISWWWWLSSCQVVFNSLRPPWTVTCQDSLFLIISQSLSKFMSIESVMPSNHLFLCRPLLLFSVFPSIRVFCLYQFVSVGQSIGASASTLVLPVSIQGWFPLGLTGLILLPKGLSRVFSSTTAKKHQFGVLSCPLLMPMSEAFSIFFIL